MTDTAVVTGASSGLGSAIASLLRQRDVSVVGVARRGPDIKGDASREETANAALAEAQRRGRVTLLVNCAGIGVFRPASQYTTEDIDAVLSSNLIAMINFCRTFLDTLRENNGTIVNVMSTAALIGKPGETVYCAAKWGARGYTEALRTEAKGVRVMAVFPGGMNTPFWATDPERAAKFMDANNVARVIVDAIFAPPALQVTDLTIARP